MMVMMRNDSRDRTSTRGDSTFPSIFDTFLLDSACSGMSANIGRRECNGLLDDRVGVESRGIGLAIIVLEVLVTILKEEEVEGFFRILPISCQLNHFQQSGNLLMSQ
jgi:hypothetical protein